MTPLAVAMMKAKAPRANRANMNWSWDDDTRRGRYALNRIRRTKSTGRVCDVVGRRFSVAVEAEPSSAIDMLGGRILSHGRREHVVGSVVKDPHSIPH